MTAVFQEYQFDPILDPAWVRQERRAVLRGGRFAHAERVEREYRVMRIFRPLDDPAVVVQDAAQGDEAFDPAPFAASGITVTFKREQFYARVTARVRFGRGIHEEISGNLSYDQLRGFVRPRLSGAKAVELVRMILKHEVA